SPPPLAIGPLLGMPFCGQGRCRGAFFLARSPGEMPFCQEDIGIARQLHVWLEQGHFFEEGRLLAQLRLLNQVAQAAAGSLDLSRILTVALRELDRHLPQYVSAVWLLENSECQEATTAAVPKCSPQEPLCLVLKSSGAPPNERAARLGLVTGL